MRLHVDDHGLYYAHIPYINHTHMLNYFLKILFIICVTRTKSSTNKLRKSGCFSTVRHNTTTVTRKTFRARMVCAEHYYLRITIVCKVMHLYLFYFRRFFFFCHFKQKLCVCVCIWFGLCIVLAVHRTPTTNIYSIVWFVCPFIAGPKDCDLPKSGLTSIHTNSYSQGPNSGGSDSNANGRLHVSSGLCDPHTMHQDQVHQHQILSTYYVCNMFNLWYTLRMRAMWCRIRALYK